MTDVEAEAYRLEVEVVSSLAQIQTVDGGTVIDASDAVAEMEVPTAVLQMEVTTGPPGRDGTGGGGAVDSVNGKDGAVVLDYTDVGADSEGAAAAEQTRAEAAESTLQTHIDSESGRAQSVEGGIELDLANEVQARVAADSLKADLVDGLVPSAQLPSYVDDVVSAANLAAFPATGEAGKIYVAVDTNLTYRWSGSAYVEISASLALGETSATAYRGDRGKTAFDHSQLVSGNPHGTTYSDVGADQAGAASSAQTAAVAAASTDATSKANAAQSAAISAAAADATTKANAAQSNAQSFATSADVTVLASAATAAAGASKAFSTITGVVPIAQVPTGTSATTVPLGNDSRFSDARTPTAHNQTVATITDLVPNTAAQQLAAKRIHKHYPYWSYLASSGTVTMTVTAPGFLNVAATAYAEWTDALPAGTWRFIVAHVTTNVASGSTIQLSVGGTNVGSAVSTFEASGTFHHDVVSAVATISTEAATALRLTAATGACRLVGLTAYRVD